MSMRLYEVYFSCSELLLVGDGGGWIKCKVNINFCGSVFLTKPNNPKTSGVLAEEISNRRKVNANTFYCSVVSILMYVPNNIYLIICVISLKAIKNS